MPIVVHKVTLTNHAGQPVYPINITAGVTIHATSNNTGPVTYQTLWESVDIYLWSKLFGCKWQKLTILGSV